MTGIARIRRVAVMGLAAASAWVWGSGQTAFGQGGAIAYEPVVNWYLNGAALTATPVVSADRRYVRMTLNPYFNTVNGFTTYSAQLGAVSGGGVGGGGIGGGGGGAGGGIGGGGGGAGGGFGGGGAGGGAFVGGMNGVVAGGGVGAPMGPLTANNTSYLAGDFATHVNAPGEGFVGGGADPFDQAAGAAARNVPVANRRFPGQAMVQGQALDGAVPEEPAGAGAFEDPAPRRAKTSTARRKAATRKSTRRPSSAAKVSP